MGTTAWMVIAFALCHFACLDDIVMLNRIEGSI
jgi:hypothetical protein